MRSFNLFLPQSSNSLYHFNFRYIRWHDTFSLNPCCQWPVNFSNNWIYQLKSVSVSSLEEKSCGKLEAKNSLIFRTGLQIKKSNSCFFSYGFWLEFRKKFQGLLGCYWNCVHNLPYPLLPQDSKKGSSLWSPTSHIIIKTDPSIVWTQGIS